MNRVALYTNGFKNRNFDTVSASDLKQRSGAEGAHVKPHVRLRSASNLRMLTRSKTDFWVHLCICIFIFLASKLCAANETDKIEIYKEGPVHEAYLIQEFGEMLIQAVPEDPPENLTEEIPPQSDQQARWIPGYWAWSHVYSDFVWVSGIWRRPPPGLQWISGYWKRYSNGWVWIKGFWSTALENKLRTVAQMPPDPIDEKPGPAPAPADSYFWIPGYWSFDGKTQSFIWFSGKWEALDVNWVYVPAHYVWREDGYVLTSAFWDWPLEQRGTVYASAYVKPDFREFAVFEPSTTLAPLFILDSYYPHWPDYHCLYHHHFYYHYDVWSAWGAIPPWWKWNDWWTLTWQDSWALWWWWTHPGYPNPVWLTPEVAARMSPPAEFVLKMMEKVRPPINVTARGVVGNTALFAALQEASGKELPIIPADPKQMSELQILTQAKVRPKKILRPTGQGSVKQPPRKPFFGPAVNELKQPPQRVLVPNKPGAAEMMQPKKPKRPVVVPSEPTPPQNGGRAPPNQPAKIPPKLRPPPKVENQKLPPNASQPNTMQTPPLNNQNKVVQPPVIHEPYPVESEYSKPQPANPPEVRFEPADTIFQPSTPRTAPLQPRVDSRPLAPKLPSNENPLELPESFGSPYSTTTYPEYPSAAPNTPQAYYPGWHPQQMPESPMYPERPEKPAQISPNMAGTETPAGIPPSTVNPPIRLETPSYPGGSQGYSPPKLSPTPGPEAGPLRYQPTIENEPQYYDTQSFRSQRHDLPAWYEDVPGEPRGRNTELDVFYGQKPTYEFPQTPLEIQPQDRVQSYPQPQKNPPGPKVHPLPDDAGRY